MTFRKLKLIDNRPSRPALNFHGKCRNTMLFSPKTRVMSVIAELTPEKKTGRGRKSLSPSLRGNCRLCGCSFKVKFGSQARHIGTENLFQPSKQKGSFGVILAKLCESVGLPVKYCEHKSDRVCSSCGRKIRNLHQLFSFVSSALINSDNENSDSSEERFKGCLPTSVSSPDRSPLSRKIKKTSSWQSSWPRNSTWPPRRTRESSVSSRVPLARVLFTISPKWRACSQATWN